MSQHVYKNGFSQQHWVDVSVLSKDENIVGPIVERVAKTGDPMATTGDPMVATTGDPIVATTGDPIVAVGAGAVSWWQDFAAPMVPFCTDFFKKEVFGSCYAILGKLTCKKWLLLNTLALDTISGKGSFLVRYVAQSVVWGSWT